MPKIVNGNLALSKTDAVNRREAFLQEYVEELIEDTVEETDEFSDEFNDDDIVFEYIGRGDFT